MKMDKNGFVFKRILWSLVRDGTRIKNVIEGYDEGCFLTASEYARAVVDGKRQTAYGVWAVNRDRSVS